MSVLEYVDEGVPRSPSPVRGDLNRTHGRKINSQSEATSWEARASKGFGAILYGPLMRKEVDHLQSWDGRNPDHHTGSHSQNTNQDYHWMEYIMTNHGYHVSGTGLQLKSNLGLPRGDLGPLGQPIEVGTKSLYDPLLGSGSIDWPK